MVLKNAKEEENKEEEPASVFDADVESARYVAGLKTLKDLRKQYHDKRNSRQRRLLTLDTVKELVNNVFDHNSDATKEEHAS